LDLAINLHHGALIEITSPTAQLLVDHSDPDLRFGGMPLTGSLVMDLPHQFLHRLPRGLRPDERDATLPVEPADGVSQKVETLFRHTPQPGLVLIDRESEPPHEPLHGSKGASALAPLAADHEVVGIVHNH
jgi:hypothetical protein